MNRSLGTPWLEETLELCERVLRKAAQEHPSNPILANAVGGKVSIRRSTSRKKATINTGVKFRKKNSSR